MVRIAADFPVHAAGACAPADVSSPELHVADDKTACSVRTRSAPVDEEALDALLTIHPGQPDARPAKLAVFDLDKTLVSNDTTVSWTNFLYDVGITADPFYRRWNEQMVKDYRAGTLDICRYYERAVEAVAGIPLATLLPIVDRFVEERVAPLIYPAGAALVKRAGTRDPGVHRFRFSGVSGAPCGDSIRPAGRERTRRGIR